MMPTCSFLADLELFGAFCDCVGFLSGASETATPAEGHVRDHLLDGVLLLADIIAVQLLPQLVQLSCGDSGRGVEWQRGPKCSTSMNMHLHE